MIAKPGGDAGDLRREEGEAAGQQREQQQRPQPVEQDRAGMVLGQRGRRLARRRAAARSAGSSRRACPGAGRSARRAPTSRRAIGDEQRVASSAPAASTVTAASAVAAPALSRTVVLRKSTNRTCLLQQRLEQPAHAAGAVDRQVGLAPPAPAGASSELTATQSAVLQRAAATSARSPRKASRSVRVVADVQRGGDRRRAQQRGDAEALVERDRRAHLEHLAPPVDRQALLAARARAISRTAAAAASSSGAPRQWNAAIASLSSLRTRSRWCSAV